MTVYMSPSIKNTPPTYERVSDLKRLEFILTTLKQSIVDGGNVLDIGCGNGIISMNLGKYGYDITGIDISEKAIAKAKMVNTYPNVCFKCQSAEQLTSEGCQYDAVICSEVLEHLDEPSDLIRKIRPLLKDEGKLIVTVPNGMGPRETLVTRPMLYLRENNKTAWSLLGKTKKVLGFRGTTVQSDADNMDHVQFFSKRALLELALRNDFQIESFKNANFMDDVFPYSILANRLKLLQKIDCKVADYLPHGFSGGFYMVWYKLPPA